MSITPSGPGNIQKSFGTDSSQNVQKNQQVEGRHRHRKVKEVRTEKKIPTRPQVPSKKHLFEFKSIKPVTPEQKQILPQRTEAKPGQPPLAPSQDGLETLRGNDRYQSREGIIRAAKKSKGWQKLDKQITKTGGLVSKKQFGKLLQKMPGMDFSDKKTVNLMALFAIEKFDSGKFTEDQMREYMGTVANCYVQAKADEQVNQALKVLPPAARNSGVGRTAILAEIAATTAEKSKGEDAFKAAFSGLKTDLQTDLYDRDSSFLKELVSKLDGCVTKINEKVAEGMQREMKHLLAEETGSNEGKMSSKQVEKIVDDVDLMVMQFVESQMRGEKQTIDNKAASGEDLSPITDVVLQKATIRRDGVVAELVKAAGPNLKSAFQQHSIPEHRQPEKVMDSWLKNNETLNKSPLSKAETKGSVEAGAKPDTPQKALDAWVDQIVELVPHEQKHIVDDQFKEELRERLEVSAEKMDIADNLLPNPSQASPFSRNDLLRRGMRRAKPNTSEPAAKTVTESLESGIKKELAKRAARKASAEPKQLKASPQLREENAISVTPEKPQDSKKPTPPATAPKPSKEYRAKLLAARKKPPEQTVDGMVSKLIRHFENIIEAEKAKADTANRPRSSKRTNP